MRAKERQFCCMFISEIVYVYVEIWYVVNHRSSERAERDKLRIWDLSETESKIEDVVHRALRSACLEDVSNGRTSE